MTTPDNKPAEIPTPITNAQRNMFADVPMEPSGVFSGDNLCVALASYFSNHMDRPENDKDDDQLGWGVWVMAKTNEALDAIVRAHLKQQGVATAQLAALEECNRALREACEACGVFTTPLERLKGWNEYKEDAAQKRNAALAQTPASVSSAFAELVEDKRRLDWLCAYITDKGLNGFEAISWTVYDEDGKSLMHRETVSEDEVEDIRFDRAAIDAAIKDAARAQPTQTQGGTEA